ncbi:MAG: NPCBM/NEW2 domain-containing protein [Pirellulales bacterium]|nr:NPCBM/NEW2 domain-containing protein [Pirellulales bacterium]
MNSIILALIFGFIAPQFEAKTLDGQTFSGALVELTADRLTLETSQGRLSAETEKLLTLTTERGPDRVRPAAGAIVELIDGSSIHVRQYLVREGRAKIVLDGGETLDAPISAVHSVRLRQSDALEAEWSRLTGDNTDSDLLIVAANGTLDSHKGVIHDVTGETVGFDLDGELLPVKRAKVYGFVYRHGLADAPPPADCLITDAAGSRWSARAATLEGNNLQWTTCTGLPVSMPLAGVVRLDYSAGKLIYLSDMTPESTNWTPYFGSRRPLPALRLFYAPRFDRGFDSDALELGGVEYRKGLALFARTELVFRLPEGFRSFRAAIGNDDGETDGKVRLIVRGDDRVLLEADVAERSAPREIELDVCGVRRLTIVVDFGDDSGAGDRLLLCNARIVK